jgi:cytochrome c
MQINYRGSVCFGWDVLGISIPLTSNLRIRGSNAFRRATKILLAVFSLIAVLTAGGSARAQDPVSYGQSLVAEFCASCHAIGVKGESPHPWAPPFRTLGRTIDLDEFPRALERGITSTHPDMPAIKFSQEEARAVRAYLRAIQQ